MDHNGLRIELANALHIRTDIHPDLQARLILERVQALIVQGDALRENLRRELNTPVADGDEAIINAVGSLCESHRNYWALTGALRAVLGLGEECQSDVVILLAVQDLLKEKR